MVKLSRMVSAVGRRVAYHTWLQTQMRRGCRIHASLEFTGINMPQEHVILGEGCTIERDVAIWLAREAGAHPTLQLGNSVFVGRNAYVGVYQPVTIGSHALIGAYSYIISANHVYASRMLPIVEQGFTGSPIVIEDDAWIGTHVVILPGVTIGKGAIVAAGSLVNKNIPAYELWGGMPARFIKCRPK